MAFFTPRIFIVLLLAISVSYKTLAMHKDSSTCKTVRLVPGNESARLSSSDSFFHQLPPDVIIAITAYSNHRNALRKTCKAFSRIASTNQRHEWVLRDSFKGSDEDIIKACEHFIEKNEDKNLQTILDRYKLNLSPHINAIGYSLTEYAIILENYTGVAHCRAMLSSRTQQYELPSWQARYHDTRYDKKSFAQLNTLFDALYAHKVTRHDSNICRNDDSNIEELMECLRLKEVQPSGKKYALFPTHIAAHTGNHELISLLLKTYSADAKATKKNWFALDIACMRGYPECVRILTAASTYLDPEIDYGSEPTLLSRKSALTHAAQRGFSECVRILLNSKKLNDPEDQCQLALLYATHIGNGEIVEQLLAQKIDPNIPVEAIEFFKKDRTITTSVEDPQPLNMAVYDGNINIVDKLLKAGALVTNFSFSTACDNDNMPILSMLSSARTNSDDTIMMTSIPEQTGDDEE